MLLTEWKFQSKDTLAFAGFLFVQPDLIRRNCIAIVLDTCLSSLKVCIGLPLFEGIYDSREGLILSAHILKGQIFLPISWSAAEYWELFYSNMMSIGSSSTPMWWVLGTLLLQYDEHWELFYSNMMSTGNSSTPIWWALGTLLLQCDEYWELF